MKLLIRWLINIISLWVSARLLATHVHFGHGLETLVIAGFVLALVNTILKPVLVLLSLPALILSLGLFMIVLNGFVVYIASRLYPDFMISGFVTAILIGVIVGLVNFAVTAIL